MARSTVFAPRLWLPQVLVGQQPTAQGPVCEELAAAVADQASRQEGVSFLPARIKSFLKDSQSLDVRRAKAMLQPILKTVHVYRDGRIELEFRGQQTS